MTAMKLLGHCGGPISSLPAASWCEMGTTMSCKASVKTLSLPAWSGRGIAWYGTSVVMPLALRRALKASCAGDVHNGGVPIQLEWQCILPLAHWLALRCRGARKGRSLSLVQQGVCRDSGCAKRAAGLCDSQVVVCPFSNGNGLLSRLLRTQSVKIALCS